MDRIQVDMFEVQLGAALLIQFRLDGGRTVRVLADAGVPRGLSTDHVHRKLPQAIKDFGGDGDRLDLIIGTHYDADHLDGLVPVINDKKISITEAWLPPVADDTDIALNDEPLTDESTLAYRFADDGENVLRRYLSVKLAVCEELRALEVIGYEWAERRGDEPRGDRRAETRSLRREELVDRRLAREYFERHLEDANGRLSPAAASHADGDIPELSSIEEIESLLSERRYLLTPDYGFYRLGNALLDQHIRRQEIADYWNRVPDIAADHARGLSYIRKSAAKDAINASSLFDVVSALKQRKVPMVCQTIRDGIPRRFVWKNNQVRFIPGKNLSTDGPVLTLLGPSAGLVQKHQHRLPIGNYMALAFHRIPIKSITPSNQLSYVIRLAHEEQGILVSGDAGCVDFKPGRQRTYYEDLLDALLPLHVVQVAHHAGNNAHFYRVLEDADFATQEDKSYLLLSHATDDRHRPSREFGQFVENVRQDRDNLSLLFTCTPKKEKVEDFDDIIHPVVGRPAREGDARIVFDGSRWVANKHAVKI